MLLKVIPIGNNPTFPRYTNNGSEKAFEITNNSGIRKKTDTNTHNKTTKKSNDENFFSIIFLPLPQRSAVRFFTNNI